MALTASGAISLNDVNVELGFSATATIAMNDAAVRTLFGIASGAINMSDGYGKANTLGFIEDVFSCFLYTGTGAAQTITNGINLAGKGGLVWSKDRSAVQPHWLVDTVRGVNNRLEANSTGAQTALGDSFPAFYSNGYGLGNSSGNINTNGNNEVSWTFRKATKFFDVLTYTGNGGTQAINHNLGSVPGFIIVKCTSSSGTSWITWHRSISTGTGHYLYLNLPNTPFTNGAETWGNNVVAVDPTSTQFTVGYNSNINNSGATYVAYLFAHNAGGYGATGTDNIVSCGSLTTDATSKATVSLGYEPQWVMIKNISSSDSWYMADILRGFVVTPSTTTKYLQANVSDIEYNWGLVYGPNSTGFDLTITASHTYIYIAIRRGPMKVPSLGTTVFSPVATSATTGTAITTNFPVDLQFWNDRGGNGYNSLASDRLRGVVTSQVVATSPNLQTAVTAAEITIFNSTRNWNNTGYAIASSLSGVNAIYWNFRRAPSFFDIVCYTGTGVARTVTHNLTVAPELLIVKTRSVGGTNRGWWVYAAPLGNDDALSLNGQDNAQTAALWNYTTPTSTVFSLNGYPVNESTTTYVAYLFATCAGVSKVGSYTGTGALQTINCGFTSGARFVLIKRTDTTGDWYTYDSARGISSGNDPYLYPNSTAAEVTGTNYVDTDSTGFKVTAAAPADLNANGGTYIFLAIA